MPKKEMTKTEMIRIRCYPETRKAFKIFVVKGGFKSSEDALLYLLRKSEDLGKLRVAR